MSFPDVLFLLLLVNLLLLGKSQLELNYYLESCPNAEVIIKDEVTKLYHKHGNTAVSWIRNLFHDCMVKSCDASILLDENPITGMQSEKKSARNFGMRNFKYINTIKEALEDQCPLTVSCADIIALSARDGVHLLGGPHIEMKTGRRDSQRSYEDVVDDYLPNHNDTMQVVLARFQSIGVDVESTVALLGAHSVGRVHCMNIVNRLYPITDSTIDSNYADYLKRRCPNPNPDPESIEDARNDLDTPMLLDNIYYKNLLEGKGLMVVDQELTSEPSTFPYVEIMADDNSYFHDKFARAMILLSENNPLTGDQGEVRMDCTRLNSG